jgi:hypothetical protein
VARNGHGISPLSRQFWHSGARNTSLGDVENNLSLPTENDTVSHMFGKQFGNYVQFQYWVLILVALAFVSRLVVGMTGLPVATVKWISINLVLLVGLFYCSIAVHTRGFGSYKQLFGLLLVQNAFAHFLVACGIALAILTGTNNIYTAPEFFGGSDGRNWGHVAAHFLAALIVPVIAWLIGSVILFITKKIKPAV